MKSDPMRLGFRRRPIRISISRGTSTSISTSSTRTPSHRVKGRPQFLRTCHNEAAVWARYIVNGKKRDVNIGFPELTGEIPQWMQGSDGYWYYHTYYPQQLDLNWHNPDVFLEFAKIVIFW